MMFYYLSKIFVVLRRKGFFNCLPNFNYIYFNFILSRSFKFSQVKPCFILRPMEMLTKSNGDKIKAEALSLLELYGNRKLNEHFDGLNSLERNNSFRWNAFYPLYFIYFTPSYRDNDVIVTYVLHWINLYIIKMNKNDFCWYDMADSFRLMFLIMLMGDNELEVLLSPIERRKIIYAIHAHSKCIKNTNLRAKGNHRIFQLYSEVVFDKFTNKRNSNAKTELLEFYAEQFSDSGVHLEHSPEYHIWAVILFTEIFKNFDHSFDNLKLALLNSREFFCTNKKISLIGDSGVEHSSEYWNIVNGKVRDEKYFNHDLSGYLILRNNEYGFYLISLFKENSKIHKHHDSASFELLLKGKKVITDSGKYSYGTDQYSRSFRERKKHNIAYVIGKENFFCTYESKLIVRTPSLKSIALRSVNLALVHVRIITVVNDMDVIIVDLFYKGLNEIQGEHLDESFSSNLNFTTEYFYTDLFDPLLGVLSVNKSSLDYSENYLEVKQGVALTMMVESLSAYSIGYNKVTNFSFKNGCLNFNLDNNEYKILVSDFLQ